jgi:hypothetical protein
MDRMECRITKADHDKALKLFTEITEYQRSHPEIYYYTRSRCWFMEAPDNPDHEIWMFIDEYDDREKYWKSLQEAITNDPASTDNNRRWMELLVPGSVPKGHEVWTELDALKVEFEGR